MMDSLLDAKRVYLATLDTIPAPAVRWLRDLRMKARAEFDKLGFPTTRDEGWKYTNVAPLLRQPFALSTGTAAVASALSNLLIAPDAPRLVFVDGHFRSDLSRVPVYVSSLSEALNRSAEALEPYLGSVAPTANHAFAALNTAFVLDGAYIRLPAGVAVEQPIHLIYLSSAEALAQPHALIVAEAGSQATVIEHYLPLSEGRHWTNAVTEIVLEPGAAVEHYRVQQQGAQAYHIGGVYVRQGRESRFTSHAVDLGGAFVRNDLQTVVAEGATCELNGLYIADGRQHVDNHTVIDHVAPRGTSRELYKGVLAGRARAVFNGRVVIQKDAQHIDAHQLNNNLLLSDDVEIDTKPEFEIYADDVKCGHGASVGQLDTDSLFYLRSRAIDETAARDLLTYAFADDIVARFRIAPLRVALEQALKARLLQGRELMELQTV
jgi:Fe-S cluster assembly protein SufD